MKERLTGAVILVALIVLLVPELLTGPTRRQAAPVTDPSEEPPLRSYTINLADESHSPTDKGPGGPAMPQPSGPEQPAQAQSDGARQPAAAAATGAGVGAAAPSTATPAASAAQSTAPQPSPPASPQKHTTRANTSQDKPAKPHPAAAQKAPAPNTSHAVSAGSGWMVQLGVFASRENAEHLVQEVRAKGFKASVSEVTGSARKLYRVRVGPAPDRAAAQDLQARLKAAGRPGGTLVPYSG